MNPLEPVQPPSPTKPDSSSVPPPTVVQPSQPATETIPQSQTNNPTPPQPSFTSAGVSNGYPLSLPSSDAQPSHRSKKPWIIAVIVLAIVGIGIGSLVFGVSSATTAQANSAMQVVKDIQTNNAQDAYSLLDSAFQQRVPLATFTQEVAKETVLLPKSEPKVTYREIDKSTQNGDTTLIQVRVAGDSTNPKGVLATVTFSKSNNKWSVSSLKIANAA